MIEIKHKENCCGCSACVQICPRKCIMMQEDEEGFLYPQVDEKKCVDCHLCENVCPVLNQSKPSDPLKVYASINKDEKIRLQSSSGGIFTALAELIIAEGGVVFGARFDDKWEVVHDYVETKEDLCKFRGSKYVQSRIENTYKEAEGFLKTGRKVLFSGTPCQIAGLRLFLRKPYNNLLAVDFVCHGVPSPGVWRRYLKEEIARQCDRKNTVLPRPIPVKDTRIVGISFRDKALGWKKFSFALDLSTTSGSGEKFSFCSRIPLNENIYLRGFLSNVFLRPSCYSCPEKKQKSGSDITLADFWGINKSIYHRVDDKGVSALIINSSEGLKVVDELYGIDKQETRIGDFANNNRCYFKSTRHPDNRINFMRSIQNRTITESIERYGKTSPKEKLRFILIKLAISIKIAPILKRICKRKSE